MRDILFRAKKTGFNEWAEGLIVSYPEKTMCLLLERTPKITWYVDENTICQYTGLTDKNGEKIFEGDIFLFGFEPCVVKYDTENARFMLYKYGKYMVCGFNVDTVKTKEVIGNIHDNPELLKGGAE